jgi:hypothetical protein
MNLAKVERVYPDTSYWVAMRCKADDNHAECRGAMNAAGAKQQHAKRW